MTQLQAELGVKNEELISLQQDNEKWKSRTQQILQKYEVRQISYCLINMDLKT
jgi:hypothetical protein